LLVFRCGVDDSVALMGLDTSLQDCEGTSCCFVVLSVRAGELLCQEGQMELNCIGRDHRVGRRLRDAVEFVTVARGLGRVQLVVGVYPKGLRESRGEYYITQR